jgi:hypothetical protein
VREGSASGLSWAGSDRPHAHWCSPQCERVLQFPFLQGQYSYLIRAHPDDFILTL